MLKIFQLYRFQHVPERPRFEPRTVVAHKKANNAKKSSLTPVECARIASVDSFGLIEYPIGAVDPPIIP